MSEALYERYKDALRRGHVASLRGRHEAALAEYVEAATIAPERALPYASIGTIYLSLGRAIDALAAFDNALDRSPADETALTGRADALTRLGRPAEAAVTLDRLSSAQEASGRSVDALDSARRALELAESRPRRGVVEALAERLRDIAADAPGSAVLAEALHLLERTAMLAPDGSTAEADIEAVARGEAVAGAATATAADRTALDEPSGPGSSADAADVDAPEAVPVGAGAGPDALAMLSEAIAAVDAGDTAGGRAGLLRAAEILDQSGRPDAALDACYEALALAPGDPDLHLTLAGLYLDRGWGALAAEKLALLCRLADLAGDEPTIERARELARARAADEPRVRDLLA